MEKYTIQSYALCMVTYHLKAGSDKLKIYIITPKATIKVTNQRVTACKPTTKVKWNHENIQLIKRKAEKRNKEWTRKTANNKMTY